MKLSVFVLFLLPVFAQDKKPADPPAKTPVSAAPSTAAAANSSAASPAISPTSSPAASTPAIPPAPPDEMHELGRALGEGGNSPQDYIRVLEAHLVKHPDSTHKAEIYKVLAKSALEAKDDTRIIKYGELVLAADPTDVQMLDRISRAYVMKGDASDAQKGLEWAKKYEQQIAKLRSTPPPGRLSAGQWSQDLDKARARALVLQSRACGVLDQKPAAIEYAAQSYASYPTAEAAREWGKWQAATGDTADAVEHLADAFTIEDALNTEADRAKDRRRMGEIYAKANGSEKGLGEIVLRAYDRTSNLLANRSEQLKSADPNTRASTILDFTLPGANGKDLKLADLKGKIIVVDFWATWCGPCKAQRPLYEQVEQKFKGNPNVIFLSVNTDEDRNGVPVFLKAQKWTQPVYFDGGLADYSKVMNIPTTLIVNKDGQVSSRMNGFIPDRFVDLLTERIQETLR